MLVLSRKLNETILIGDNIRVTLLGVDGDKIKVGVDAPRDIKVFREELIEATKSTNKQALDAPVVSFDLSKIKKTSVSAPETSQAEEKTSSAPSAAQKKKTKTKN